MLQIPLPGLSPLVTELLQRAACVTGQRKRLRRRGGQRAREQRAAVGGKATHKRKPSGGKRARDGEGDGLALI